MKTLDDYFAQSTETMHPRLRDWKARLAEEGTSATVEIYKPHADLGQSQPEMNIQFTKGGVSASLETVSWDDDLNAGLIQLGVRALTGDQEAVRFSLGLRSALRKAEREFGDGYFNAVLFELLNNPDFRQHEEIADILEHAYANAPHRENKPLDRYSICRGLIDIAISGRAHELTDSLGYKPEEAKQILVSALGRYLDERFSISSRRRMGLL
ncbi:MAG: hypothetical protein WEA31_04915 [Pirellulales bacterium]